MTLDDNENEDLDLANLGPESWLCVDCGNNTAPGLYNRSEMKKAIEAAEARGEWGPKPGGGEYGIEQTIDNKSEVYTVRAAVWQRAGMAEFGGCLCIGCLEKRLGRRLRPKDFPRDRVFNVTPGTQRLMKRRR